MEEFLYDLCNSDKLTSEISCELYDTEKTLQVLGDFLKLLKFDNSDATKYIKSKLEQCVTSNKFLQSLFIENNKNNFKRTTQVYTRHRHISMPTMTLRSIYIVRQIFMNEKIDEDLLLNKLLTNEMEYDDYLDLMRLKGQEQVQKIVRGIANNNCNIS